MAGRSSATFSSKQVAIDNHISHIVNTYCQHQAGTVASLLIMKARNHLWPLFLKEKNNIYLLFYRNNLFNALIPRYSPPLQ